MKEPKKIRAFPWEWFGLVVLAALAVYFVSISWRKWPDPLIDFGRELYVPWRLSTGAVLFRDIDEAYGPFSQYVNAALFRAFGVSLMVLVIANLAIFAAIVSAIYVLFRRAWGRLATFISTALFIAVFGFSQYNGDGNYNYATPYAHEATHGFLVCLLLLLVLYKWMELPSLSLSALAGLFFGLTIVVKTEFVFAAALITSAAFIFRWRTARVPLPVIGAWAAGMAFPFASFVAFFGIRAGWKDALRYAGWGVVNAVWYASSPVQKIFTGLDKPVSNAVDHLLATAIALIVIAAIIGVAWLSNRSQSFGIHIALIGAVWAAVLWLGFVNINWYLSGRCLLGLNAIYIALCLFRLSKAETRISALRLCLALLAASLMLRMPLNGRLYQYGFYQAALAGVLIPAVMIVELPEWLKFGRWGKWTLVSATLLLFVAAGITLVGEGGEFLEERTFAIGSGGDQFYSFEAEVDPRGVIITGLVNRLVQMQHEMGGPQALIVLPEGAMINYLARSASPLRELYFYSFSTEGGREAAIVEQLSKHPPTLVALLSRPLHEYGISRYGQVVGEGKQILDWVYANYTVESKVGGDPLDPEQIGGVLYRHNPH